ncbi:MAG TPA: TIGR00282 family metallophosphoesterase [Pseudogracilibacillus sp.]|nr:TIGR00282 family metallophosphoesterase [Pseudogracilibacillus sp.]
MKILFIGDVVGSPGRKMVEDYLPRLKEKYRPQLTIVNGENAAAGKGITEKIYKQLLNAGAQVVTMGNHTWNKREIFEFIDDAPYLIRPANFPANNPGKGIVYVTVNDEEVAVINLQGRVFLDDHDNPFQIGEDLINEARKRTNKIIVDFHAEATSEKLAFAWYVDGKVSAVLGTHTHVQTADERILPKGTAYITDVGMTGPYNGIIGVEREAVINRFLTNLPARFEVDRSGPNQINGCFLQLNPDTGVVEKIERIAVNEDKLFLE